MKKQLVIALLLTGCIALRAQSAAPESGPLTVSVNTLGVISLNPTLDLEYALTSSWSVAGTAWYEVRDVRDRWAQLRLSWYPGGVIQSKLGLSLTGGVHRAWPEEDSAFEESSDTAPTLGMLAQYSWRLGSSKRTFLSVVVGAKKCLSDSKKDSPLESGYAEGRLNLGRIF